LAIRPRFKETKLGAPESSERVKRITANIGGDRRYPLLWLVVVGEIALGVVLGVRSTSALQSGDTINYTNEAIQAASGDFSWIAGVHNYLYPSFLALLHTFGLWSRLQVGVVQLALLYSASLVLVLVLSRSLRLRLVPTGVVVCGVVIVPAAAWSGYWLTESVAAPMLLIILALWVLTCFQMVLRPTAVSTTATIFALGLTSALAWMTRPALIWVPVVAGLMVSVMIVASTVRPVRRRHGLGTRPSLWAVRFGCAFLGGAALAVIPQLALDPHIGHLLKLDLARGQAQGSSTIWRFASNFSGCGPAPLAFSPLSSDLGAIQGGQIAAPQSPLWGLTGVVAHLVSGWDPLPSPTYMTSFSAYPWILVTTVSGFVCASPLFLSCWLAAELRSLRTGWHLRNELPAGTSRFAFAAAVAGVLAFFGVTQLQLLMTGTEFRFNLMGWLSADVCLVLLIASGWFSPRRLTFLLGVGIALSACILIIGQMTLDYSPYWLQCR
jgi:hypothetical protein